MTVNDVLMAAPPARCAAHRGPRRSSTAPPLVPLNLRPLDEPLSPELGNRFGVVLADLPVEIEDQIDRLWEVNRRMDAIKHSDEGAISYGILDLMGRPPGSRRG